MNRVIINQLTAISAEMSFLQSLSCVVVLNYTVKLQLTTKVQMIWKIFIVLFKSPLKV